MKKTKKSKKTVVTGTRKITNYLKRRGMETVLKECDNNLRIVKNHIKRVCDLPKNINMGYVMAQIRDYIHSNFYEKYNTDFDLIYQFLKENFGGEDNVY